MWEVWKKENEKWIDAHEKGNAKSDQVDKEMDEIAEPPPDLLIPLLRYQKEWLAWALKQEESEITGGILADEMGMGKTIQAIALVLAKRAIHRSTCGSSEPSPSPSSSTVLPETKCTLVICPVVAMKQWESEIYQFTPKGSTRVLVYHGPKRKKSSDEFFQYDFVLTTYSTVMAEYRNVISVLHSVKWERIILDEAHYIKSRYGSAAKAVFALESSYKWALSGTVLQAHVGELFSLVRFLQITPYSYIFCEECDCKSLEYRKCNCGHLRHFLWWKRYISKPILAPGNYFLENRRRRRAMILLKHKLLKSIALRRTKKGRAADISLPDKIVHLRRDYFDIKEEDYYKSLYNESQSQFNIYVENRTILNNFMHIFQLLTRLRQAADHPYLVVYSQTAALKNRNTGLPDNGEQVCDICLGAAEDPVVTSCQHVFCKDCLINYSAAMGEEASCPSCSNMLTTDSTSKLSPRKTKRSSILDRIRIEDFQTSTKIEALREEIYVMIQRDGSAKGVVFSQFTSFLDLISYSLEKSGINCVQLVGSMNLTARDSAIKKFNDDPGCKIFLVSLKAGGVALNLTVASHVFLMDPWWNPTVEWQAIDRIHRIGQYKPVWVTRFIIENTIEERILKLQEKKKLVFEGTVGGSPEALGRLTANDLRFLFHT
ncbi:ATP-dependent helicase rhp16-like [Telopea speciosissima]|uniref:ATP-dependent helicase rhp16-like n=1 Tax=Telopea speciosissima TaxID=54955 RepID=UPI001CC3EB79|nr:ATP-dependent helicase rhp16-like [Telopea speciosissima]